MGTNGLENWKIFSIPRPIRRHFGIFLPIHETVFKWSLYMTFPLSYASKKNPVGQYRKTMEFFLIKKGATSPSR